MSNEVQTTTTKDLATVGAGGLPALTFTEDQLKLIRDTICKGADANEFALFMYTCKHLGLNPLLRQIHAVKRWDAKLQREAMALQTGIDGYRLIAERTKKYAPGKEATFVHDDKGAVVSATAYVKKLVGGEWHEVAATAYYAEYVQTTKEGKPNSMWGRMPHSQLAKCAEALALRRAFPNDTAGVYTDEEMGQADNIIDQPGKPNIEPPKEKKPEQTADSQAQDPYVKTFIPEQVEVRSGGGEDDKKNVGKEPGEKGYVKAWTKFGVQDPADGAVYGTFNENEGAIAQEACDHKKAIKLTWKDDGKYKTITSIVPA